MDSVDDPLAPWRTLEAQRAALPLEDQAIFILVCVESILSMRPARGAAGQEYLHAIWDAIGADRSKLSTIAEALDQRPDIDDHDELAALLHAVETLRGSHDAAAWGARRLLADAYERIPRDGSDDFFPPLADDTAHETVQDELRWQRSVLASLSANDHAARIAHLREQARTRGEASH
ncbi:hypothetical protein [Occultella kanbiaonis]|uniref:hypothetical protein n=1 Tax=Occultella kanbiaonis TaxID=2675754 RepID=UPI0012B72E25|nr:hypothetical protein [Occultella kanbiaonis]